MKAQFSAKGANYKHRERNWERDTERKMTDTERQTGS